jgi:hypothetical protein
VFDGRQSRGLFRRHGPGEWHDIHRRVWRLWLGLFFAEDRRFRARPGGSAGSAHLLQFSDARGIAAYAKSSVTAEVTVAVEHRKSGQFGREQCIGAVHRENDDDATPSFMRSNGARNLARGIESKRRYDLAPRFANERGGLRSDQRDERPESSVKRLSTSSPETKRLCLAVA